MFVVAAKASCGMVTLIGTRVRQSTAQANIAFLASVDGRRRLARWLAARGRLALCHTGTVGLQAACRFHDCTEAPNSCDSLWYMPSFATVDDYIAAQSAQAQPRLRELRAIIRATIPDAAEVISYDMPTYNFPGGFVSFGAAKKHCALYGTPIDLYPEEVSGYSTSKG